MHFIHSIVKVRTSENYPYQGFTHLTGETEAQVG